MYFTLPNLSLVYVRFIRGKAFHLQYLPIVDLSFSRCIFRLSGVSGVGSPTILAQVGFFEIARAVSIHTTCDRCISFNSKTSNSNCAELKIVSDFGLILDMAAFGSNVTLSSVSDWTSGCL